MFPVFTTPHSLFHLQIVISEIDHVCVAHTGWFGCASPFPAHCFLAVGAMVILPISSQPAAKRRRTEGKFVGNMKKVYRKKKQVVITAQNLPGQLAKLGQGRQVWYTLASSNMNFVAPTLIRAGVFIAQLAVPLTWTATFGTPTSANEERSACVKTMHIQLQVKGSDAPVGPTFFHFFLVSLTPAGFAYIDGLNLTDSNFVQGQSFFASAGTCHLNTDFFRVHKSWRRIMSDKINDALSPSTQSLYDNQWLIDYKHQYNHVMKGLTAGWKDTIERDVPPQHRRYIIGFQCNWINTSDNPAQVNLNTLYQVIY
jgi:hypothetical protein